MSEKNSTDYKVGDCVWVKLRGFPHWPARIDKIENKKYTVSFFLFIIRHRNSRFNDHLLTFKFENTDSM